MQPTRQLTDEIHAERVKRSRQMPAEEKLLAGTVLYDEVCERMKAGIRNAFPDLNEHEVNQRHIQQVDRVRRIEEYGIYSECKRRAMT